MSKFKDVPVEEDTKVLARVEARLDPFDVLYEKWYWDGVTGESFIFLLQDVEQLSDEALKALCCESPLVTDKNSMTITRGESGYAFVSFNFEHQE